MRLSYLLGYLLGYLPALFLAAGAAAATGAERIENRIEIQADSAELDQAAARSVYRGDVVLTRNGLELRGNELVVIRDSEGEGDGGGNGENRIIAVLTGEPARLRQTPAGEDAAPVTGSAERMTYEAGRERIELRGNAVVTRGGNAMQGDVITHDLASGHTTAQRTGEEDGGRVRIILDPPPGAGAETGANAETEAETGADAGAGENGDDR